jgi:hypothetical protein
MDLTDGLNLRVLRHHMTRQPAVDLVLTWLQHRGLRGHDVFIASYPRSGSTWLRFMLYELVTGAESSFAGVDQTLADIGYQHRAPGVLPNGGRLLKTHEPYRCDYKKSIFLVRDVRDVVVSEYVFTRRERFFAGDFDEFFRRFMAGRVNRYGFWGNHTRAWLEAAQQHPGQVLGLRFEDLRQDPIQTVMRCLRFLGVDRDVQAVERAVDAHSLRRMQAKEDQEQKFAANADGLRFITDGAVGKGQHKLTPAQEQELVGRVAPELKQLGYLE